MAKGVEDTAFYIYNRLCLLNEVGGDPDRFGMRLPTFHQAMPTGQRASPACPSATSTHDTKRSEDVRLASTSSPSAGRMADVLAALERIKRDVSHAGGRMHRP